LDQNEIAALLESLCERPFAGDRQPPVLPALARAHADEKQSGSIPGQAEARQAENFGPAELASILSGTATNAQCDGFQAAASSSGAVRLEAQSALAFVDGIAQAPLAAPADLVEQVLASPGNAPSRPRSSIRSRLLSHLLGRRIGARRGQVAAACVMMLLAGGVSWSLLRGPADMGPDGVAVPAATSPKSAPIIGAPEPALAPAPGPVPDIAPAPAPPLPLSAPAPALTPLLGPATVPGQALANPCEPRSFAASEAGARSKVESKAAKPAPDRQPKSAVAAAPDPGCAVNAGAVEAGRNPQADQGTVRAARPAAKIGRFDRDQPAAAASAPAAGPRPGTAIPASPAMRPSVVTPPH
jgi:hypothetical protein